MSSRPLVTIVTPSFNQGAFLEEAIVSVLDQDYEPLEYIVVDGGSTDGSVEIIERYAHRLAWWTSGPDGGQAAALDAAFARARGEYLGWLNADDALLPGSVSLVAATLGENPDAQFAYGDAIHVDGASRRTAYFLSADLDAVDMVRTCTDHINPQGALFRRRAIEIGRPLTGYYCWDFELVLRLGVAGSAVRIERPLATFRLHPDSKSVGSSPIVRAEDYLAMYERFFASPDLPAAFRDVESEAWAACLVWVGQLFYAGGDHARARSCIVRALRLHPSARSARTVSYLARTLLPPAAAVRLRALRT